MNVDKTTKVMLFLIATALWLNLLKPLFPAPANAGFGAATDVNIVAVNSQPLLGEAVPVKRVRRTYRRQY